LQANKYSNNTGHRRKSKESENVKEVLETLQTVDKQIDDSRYYMTLNDNKDVTKDLIFDKLNEVSKEIKTLINKIN